MEMDRIGRRKILPDPATVAELQVRDQQMDSPRLLDDVAVAMRHRVWAQRRDAQHRRAPIAQNTSIPSSEPLPQHDLLYLRPTEGAIHLPADILPDVENLDPPWSHTAPEMR